jgi:NADH-quinone oxidoreductase subunit L
MMMNTAYILIPALPFAAFLIIALGSRWVGEASHRLAIPAVSASFILSVLACIDVYQNGARSIPLYTLITSGRLTVEAGLYVDAVTVVLLFLVTGVSSLVHVFSSRYMQADPRYARFFALIALFTSAMVMLVMGANLFMLFMFWEIMGLCSYLLISHWSRFSREWGGGYWPRIRNLPDVGHLRHARHPGDLVGCATVRRSDGEPPWMARS